MDSNQNQQVQTDLIGAQVWYRGWDRSGETMFRGTIRGVIASGSDVVFLVARDTGRGYAAQIDEVKARNAQLCD